MKFPDNIGYSWGTPGEAVPPIDPNDLKRVVDTYEYAKTINPKPNTPFMIGIASLLSPGANVMNVFFRSTSMGIAMRHLSELEHLCPDGNLSERLINAFAVVPMKWHGFGEQLKEWPFDVQKLEQLLNEESDAEG